jgi:hypothetical protein
MVRHSPRAFPLGVAPPVGAHQGKGKHGRSARGRRPRRRKCLRKGCGRKYLPRCWNQRYCQDPECRRQVLRWQAARRQANHRKDAEVQAQHARAERERRQQARSAPQAVENPQVTPARGHAAEPFFPLRYAIDPGATNHPRARLATLLATAALPAAKRFASSRIANGSGFLAALSMAVGSEPSSTRPRTDAAVYDKPPSSTRHRRGRLQTDDSSQSRRSSIIALPSRGLVSWGRLITLLGAQACP